MATAFCNDGSIRFISDESVSAHDIPIQCGCSNDWKDDCESQVLYGLYGPILYCTSTTPQNLQALATFATEELVLYCIRLSTVDKVISFLTAKVVVVVVVVVN